MSRKPKVFNTLKLEDPLRGRFNLQLDSIDEGGEIPVVQNVQVCLFFQLCCCYIFL